MQEHNAEPEALFTGVAVAYLKDSDLPSSILGYVGVTPDLLFMGFLGLSLERARYI